MKNVIFLNLSVFIYFLADIFCVCHLIYNKRDKLNLAAKIFIIFGFIIHTTGIIFRIAESGHAPFINLYESLIYFSWAIVLFYFYVEFKYQLFGLGIFVVTLSVLALIYAKTLSPGIQPLVPILQSLWLEIHVAVIFIGYAGFAVSYGCALLYLLKFENKEIHIREKFSSFSITLILSLLICFFSMDIYQLFYKISSLDFLNRNILNFSLKKSIFVLELALSFFIAYWFITKKYGAIKTGLPFIFSSLNVCIIIMALFSFLLKIKYSQSIINILIRWAAFAFIYFILNKKSTELKNRLPEIEIIGKIAYKAVVYAFPFLTFGIITGAIWANEAWGNYWSWDPKETWSLITWFIYAAYLHARKISGWTEIESIYITVYGFWAVIFTYFGVSLLLPGLHSYG
ncbi:MAG: c-type cytochrome biogenesis protein CcsB [bacterium]